MITTIIWSFLGIYSTDGAVEYSLFFFVLKLGKRLRGEYSGGRPCLCSQAPRSESDADITWPRRRCNSLIQEGRFQIPRKLLWSCGTVFWWDISRLWFARLLGVGRWKWSIRNKRLTACWLASGLRGDWMLGLYLYTRWGIMLVQEPRSRSRLYRPGYAPVWNYRGCLRAIPCVKAPTIVEPQEPSRAQAREETYYSKWGPPP